MDPTTMTAREIMLYGLLINSGIGILFGLIPLIMGFVKRNLKFGILGFIGSIVGGTLLGIFLSIPVAAIFTWFIIKGARQNTEAGFQAADNHSQHS